MTRKLTTSGRDREKGLADFLAERLGLEIGAAGALVRAGGVYVGRSRVEDPTHRLGAGDRIVVHEVAATPSASFAIAYRDADVLVVEKPAGVPSQATRERSRGALDRAVQASEPSARLFHRLDRDASGLVLFTRTVDAQRRFSEWLAAGRIERRYTAVVCGHVERDEGILDRPIGPDPSDRRRMTAGVGRAATTRFRVMKRGRSIEGAATTLLELDLVTGRTHQIRVHLSDAGHPLCGDGLYGAAGRDPGGPVGEPGGPAGELAAPAREPGRPRRLCLHSCRLAWQGAEPVISPVPASFRDLVDAE